MRTELERGQNKHWYIYLDGGAVDLEHYALLLRAVVLAKDW